MNASLAGKYARLRERLAAYRGVVLAYSGGADSTLLLQVAHDVLGERLLAVTATSETYTPEECERAVRMARERGIRHRTIRTCELDKDAFRTNPPDRCYHCKYELLDRLRELAAAEGLAAVADGTNVDDAGDYRPGRRAADELGVIHPLADAGFTKADVRALSRELGLPTADLPAAACLASRFPYGERLTAEKLARVADAERFLRARGFAQVRVRAHGDLARIEVDPGDIARLTEPTLRTAVSDELRRLGFLYVSVDLEGYRTGSLNRALAPEQRADRGVND